MLPPDEPEPRPTVPPGAAVTTVVVSYNSERDLRRSLPLLLAGSGVLVVDNASADRSVAIARELGAETLLLPTNVGFGSAVNAAVCHLSLGEAPSFIFVCNPDLMVSPGVLGVLTRHLEIDPSLGVVAPLVLNDDGSRQLTGRPFPSLWHLGRRARQGFSASTENDLVGAHDWVIGAAMMMRTTDFLKVGGFDPRFFLYAEDVDLCWRFRSAGFSVRIVGDAQATHRYHRSSRNKLDMFDPSVRHHWRSILRLLGKYPLDALRWEG